MACVTVVIITWQGRHLLASCLESVAAQTLPHQVLVVDNGSDDGTADYLRSNWPQVQLLTLATNTGFAGGVSAALGQVQTPYVALLNNDARAHAQWLAASVAELDRRPDCAAVSARMLLDTSSPPRINNAGIVLLANGYGADRGLGAPDGPDFAEAASVFGASGGACVLRTLAVKAIGGIAADYFMYYEDADLSWRLRLAGWDIRYTPDAVVHHRHAATSDPGSRSFAFHNERNRLVTLARNAPLGFVLRCWARYVLTTVSVTVRYRKTAPWQQQPLLRLAAFASAAARLPGSWAVRRRSTGRRRRQVLQTWRAVPAR